MSLLNELADRRIVNFLARKKVDWLHLAPEEDSRKEEGDCWLVGFGIETKETLCFVQFRANEKMN